MPAGQVQLLPEVVDVEVCWGDATAAVPAGGGGGAVEVFWRHANAFESEVALRPELLTLHELNRLWEAYLELRYLQETHSTLGITPKQAVADVKTTPVPPDVVRELFLVRATRKVDKKDACVQVDAVRFLGQIKALRWYNADAPPANLATYRSTIRRWLSNARKR